MSQQCCESSRVTSWQFFILLLDELFWNLLHPFLYFLYFFRGAGGGHSGFQIMFLQSYTNKDENRLSRQVEIRRRQYSILRSSLTRRLAQTIRFIPLASNVSTDLYLFCFIFFLFYMSFARVKVGGLSLVFLQVTLCRPIFWRGSARLQTLEGTIVDLVCVSLFLSFFFGIPLVMDFSPWHTKPLDGRYFLATAGYFFWNTHPPSKVSTESK